MLMAAEQLPENGARLLSADELADRWGVPKSHVYRLAREHRLPDGVVVELGRYRRFRLMGIEEWEANGGTREAA
jgi:excisionase family DNA binding protein